RASPLRAPPTTHADHDDRLGARVLVEQLQRVGVRGADDGIAADADAGGLPDAARRHVLDRGVVRVAYVGIAADADAGGLPDAERRQLAHGLVGQRPAAADDTHRAAL